MSGQWFARGHRAASQRWMFLLGLMCGFHALPAQAVDALVTAQYRGDPRGHFEDTTPEPADGTCNRFRDFCTSALALPIAYQKVIGERDDGGREGYYLRLPARQVVQVVHEATGEVHSLRFEIQAYAQRVRGRDPLGVVRGGCTSSGSVSGNQFAAHVLNPARPEACWRSSIVGGRAELDWLAIKYRMVMPSPAKMTPGMYRGQLRYQVGGAGADFDLGDAFSNLSRSSVDIGFELDVQHTFAVEFAPGSERAVLEPEGGWLQWINGGGPPQRLYRDLPMRLWSTGRFKVYKLCQYDVASHCGIRNPNNDQVPVTVELTLPSGIEQAGTRGGRVTLPTGLASALVFDPVTPVHNRPGQLHFQVERDAVRGMLAHAGTTYQGQVTVVFDAEL